MKLVFLYGPPASGKLTVARELSKITGYKVFHNHLTTDLVRSIFEKTSKKSGELIDKYRLQLIEAAAKEKVNLIFTFVYAKPQDDGFVKKIVTIVEKNKGKICFVQLQCDQKQLFKRVRNPSRRNFGKVRKVKSLKDTLLYYNLSDNVSHSNNLQIDTNKLSLRKAAKTIQDYFRL